VAHQPAVFFTQFGTPWDVSNVWNTLTCIILSLTKNSIAFTNSVSDITSVAHQPAVFFTQFGTFSAIAFGIKIVPDNTNVAHNSEIVILFFNYIVKIEK
jgi:hypothetical protein